MMEGFPVPDLDFDDDEPIPGLYSPGVNSMHCLTEEEYRDLCDAHDIVMDQDTPIKCTSNSSVYRAVCRNDGSPCAVKITSHKRRVREEFNKRKMISNSPFLVETFGFHEGTGKALLRMELCLDGDISMMQFSEQRIWHLIHDIGTALSQLHNAGWMHLDVSPGNILVSGDIFKLADFGTLTRIGEFVEGNEGAGPYVSPEALAYPFGIYSVGDRSDIFSFGVVLLEVATGQVAPRGGSEGYVKIRQGQLGLGMGSFHCQRSEDLQKLVNLMLSTNPSERPSADELVTVSMNYVG
jgi:serine/threonine protein kinase